MAIRKYFRREDDVVLRRARHVMARAKREVGSSLGRYPSQAADDTRGQMSPEQRRRIVSLIADLDLVIKAMRSRRDQLGSQAGMVFQRRQVVSAYHRASLILRPDKHARR
jgi:hypothetical protein